jgi:hypothetical protein
VGARLHEHMARQRERCGLGLRHGGDPARDPANLHDIDHRKIGRRGRDGVRHALREPPILSGLNWNGSDAFANGAVITQVISGDRFLDPGQVKFLQPPCPFDSLGKDFEKPTVKQHLAAIRMLFDWLVTGQVVATNPAHAVRGPKHVVKTGKTTVLTGEQARELLDSIDVSTLKGKRWWVRLHEKGGKRHEMPAHHNLEAYLDAYIEAAKIRDAGKAPCSAPPSAAPAC